MRNNKADGEVHGFRCKLPTCKCQELHGPRKQPGRRMHGRNRNGGEKEQCTGNITPAVGREDFHFFFRFENTAKCTNKCLTTCLFEPTLSACLRCRALIGSCLHCYLCGLTALCSAALCLRSKKSKEFREDSPTNNIIVGNYGLRRAERWEGKPSLSPEVGEIYK